MFYKEIVNFLHQHYSFPIEENPENLPYSPFNYIFLPQLNTTIHCVESDKQTTFDFVGLTNHFSEKNIKIIHLWSDIWKKKQKIVESRLLSILGKTQKIPARLCKIERIDKLTLDKFLKENHLQGTTSAKLKYGLFLPKKYFRILNEDFTKTQQINPQHQTNQKSSDIKHPSSDIPHPTSHIPPHSLLVAVASFSNAKTIIRDGSPFRSYELIRFANLRNCTVVGGLNKLLKNFIAEHSPDDLMTYADRDWSDGKNYQKLGFELLEITPPQYFYLDTNNLERLYPNKINDSLQQQFTKVWNTGNLKFLMKIKKNI